ncbi:hypothetical protein CHARACLAT_014760 [Characodon lateralis]|uniref:Uncharacterized protein n=1 Tax=Characodon lateralis TaxID=208331 RepID=A0ABU7DGP6_9TELE|nr:hypothetical protein [Characodon lateralis]
MHPHHNSATSMPHGVFRVMYSVGFMKKCCPKSYLVLFSDQSMFATCPVGTLQIALLMPPLFSSCHHVFPQGQICGLHNNTLPHMSCGYLQLLQNVVMPI